MECQPAIVNSVGEMEDVANALRSIRVLRVFGKLKVVEGLFWNKGAWVFHQESSVFFFWWHIMGSNYQSVLEFVISLAGDT